VLFAAALHKTRFIPEGALGCRGVQRIDTRTLESQRRKGLGGEGRAEARGLEESKETRGLKGLLPFPGRPGRGPASRGGAAGSEPGVRLTPRKRADEPLHWHPSHLRALSRGGGGPEAIENRHQPAMLRA
jgi:hypothetical protein